MKNIGLIKADTRISPGTKGKLPAFTGNFYALLMMCFAIPLFGGTEKGGFASAEKMEEKDLKMEENNFVFENVSAVTGVKRDTVPSDTLFAEQGKTLTLGKTPWNFSALTGPKAGNSVLVRASVNVPQDGWYMLGAGADWWLRLWIDGVPRMDVTGGVPPDELDHQLLLELKKGKHIIDFNFSRGNASAMLTLSLKWHGKTPRFGVDLECAEGKLRKELHGANTTLILSSRAMNKYDADLRTLNFTMARTHDWPLWNPGQRIIDTHFIFPLMKLDPKDPSNYCFGPTDEIIRLTQEEGGMEVFYRLGTSIEHTGTIHFNAVPPEDHEKYAEVLAGIVRHYTKGWANGFHYNIRYWEIWNEPDGIKNMWTAPYETFIPFFVTVLKRLKSEFPEMQFGGPAMSSDSMVRFVPLLQACREAGVTPDFISWHSYTEDAGNLIIQPVKMRRRLDEMGFTGTKLCINEWHYNEPGLGVSALSKAEGFLQNHKRMTGINSGVFNTAVLSGWQYGPLDLAMWYGSSWDSPSYGYRDIFKNYTKNYHSLELYGIFLRNYTVLCHADSMNYIYLLAATSEDKRKAGITISDFKGTQTDLRIPVRGIEKYTKFSAIVLDEKRNNEAIHVTIKDGCLLLKKEMTGSAAFLVQMDTDF